MIGRELAGQRVGACVSVQIRIRELMPCKLWPLAQASRVLAKKQVMGARSGLTEDQLLVATQTFLAHNRRDSD